MDTNLREKFERIIENCDGRTYFQVNQYYFDLMQAAYRLAKSESEAIIKALSENTESMGETNKQLAKRLLAIQNILDEFNDDSNTYDMLSKIRTILKPTKESLLASVGDGWISVESELPGGQMPVIVYTVNGYTQTAFFEDDSSSWVGIGNFRAPKVTHWMPLPQPPQQ